MIMNENIDQAAQDREDHDSMVESTVDRQIFAEMDMVQPKVTDFTKVKHIGGNHSDRHVLGIKLDSGRIERIGWFNTQGDAEAAELAVNQAMIEYRTKMNAWEKQIKKGLDKQCT